MSIAILWGEETENLPKVHFPGPSKGRVRRESKAEMDEDMTVSASQAAQTTTQGSKEAGFVPPPNTRDYQYWPPERKKEEANGRSTSW